MSRFANVEMNREVCSPEFVEISKKSSTLILRQLSSCLSKHAFRQLLYASLTGIQVLVRGPKLERLEALYALSHLVPRACRRVHVTASEYTENEECNNFLGTKLRWDWFNRKLWEKVATFFFCLNFRSWEHGCSAIDLLECLSARNNRGRTQKRNWAWFTSRSMGW